MRVRIVVGGPKSMDSSVKEYIFSNIEHWLILRAQLEVPRLRASDIILQRHSTVLFLAMQDFRRRAESPTPFATTCCRLLLHD